MRTWEPKCPSVAGFCLLTSLWEKFLLSSKEQFQIFGTWQKGTAPMSTRAAEMWGSGNGSVGKPADLGTFSRSIFFLTWHAVLRRVNDLEKNWKTWIDTVRLCVSHGC